MRPVSSPGQSPAQSDQHQVKGLGCHLEEPGTEWHCHLWTRQEQFDKVRQLRIAAALVRDPVHQLTGKDQAVEILVSERDRFLDHRADALDLLELPLLPAGGVWIA